MYSLREMSALDSVRNLRTNQHYPGQQVVVENAVFTVFQSKGHAAIVGVEGGAQSLSSTIAPFEHRTPTLTHAPASIHVVEQDLGGVNSAAAVVVILFGLLADEAWLDTG